MTGYRTTAIVDQGRLDPGVALIQKPLTSDQLAAMVRKVSESYQRDAASAQGPRCRAGAIGSSLRGASSDARKPRDAESRKRTDRFGRSGVEASHAGARRSGARACRAASPRAALRR